MIAAPDSTLCPERFKISLRRYADQHIPTGGFLRAVLQNELAESIGYADPESLAHIRDVIAYVHETVPAVAWGNKDRVAAWLAGRT